MAAGDLLFADRWLGELPMGGSLYSSGFYAPAQRFLLLSVSRVAGPRHQLVPADRRFGDCDVFRSPRHLRPKRAARGFCGAAGRHCSRHGEFRLFRHRVHPTGLGIDLFVLRPPRLEIGRLVGCRSSCSRALGASEISDPVPGDCDLRWHNLPFRKQDEIPYCRGGARDPHPLSAEGI